MSRQTVFILLLSLILIQVNLAFAEFSYAVTDRRLITIQPKTFKNIYRDMELKGGFLADVQMLSGPLSQFTQFYNSALNSDPLFTKSITSLVMYIQAITIEYIVNEIFDFHYHN